MALMHCEASTTCQGLHLKTFANGLANSVALAEALSKLGQEVVWHDDECLTGCELSFGLNMLFWKTVQRVGIKSFSLGASRKPVRERRHGALQNSQVLACCLLCQELSTAWYGVCCPRLCRQESSKLTLMRSTNFASMTRHR